MTQLTFIQGQTFPRVEDGKHEFKHLQGNNVPSKIKDITQDYIVSFLNAKGGAIYYGIDNDRVIHGTKISYEQADLICRVIIAKVEQIFPTVSRAQFAFNIHPVHGEDEIALDDSYVIEIIVPPGDPGEIYRTSRVNGKRFFRLGNEKRELPQAELREEIRLRNRLRRGIKFGIPNLNHQFIGRTEELASLHEELQQRRGIALYGLSGSGKSSLARQYAHRYANEYTFVAWLAASEAASLRLGVIDLARQLCLWSLVAENISDNPELQLDCALKIINSLSGWLIVYDNVNNTEVDISKILPNLDQGFVFCTTIAPEIPHAGLHSVKLPKLTPEDALSYLQSRSGIRFTEDDSLLAERLLKEIDYLPLAIEEVGSYLKANRSPLHQYLRELQALETRWSALFPSLAVTTQGGAASSVRAWNFERVLSESPASAELLQISAYWSPDFMPEQLLLGGAQELGLPILSVINQDPTSALRLDPLFQPLIRYSLVERVQNSGESGYRMHRMVQAFMRAYLANDGSVAERAVSIVAHAFPATVTYEDWPICRALLPSVESLLRHIDRVSAQSRAALLSASLFERAALYLREQASHTQAERLIRQGVSQHERASGADDLATARALDLLARILVDQAKWAEALVVCERSLGIRRRQLDPNDPRLAQSLHTLALVLRGQDRRTEALTACRQSLGIYEGTPAAELPEGAEALNTLGNLFTDQSNLRQAELAYMRSLDIRQRSLGIHHPDTFRSWHNLAWLRSKEGKLREAEKLYRQSHVAKVRSLGIAHPHTIMSLDNLAWVLSEEHQTDEAEELFKKSLNIRQEAPESTPEDVAQAKANLGAFYYQQSRYVEAEEQQRACLQLREQFLGEVHPDTFMDRQDLASTLEAQRNLAAAANLYQLCVELCEKDPSTDPKTAATAHAALGAFYYRQSNFAEAEKHHRMCMEIRKKLLGDIHPDTLTAQQALANTLETQGNRTEAAELYQSCVGLCEKDSRANQLTLAQAHAALGAFCYRQSRYAEAAKQERRCLQIREQLLGDAHPDTILARRALADTVEEEGKRADSTQLYQRNVELCEKNTTIDQLTTAQAKADLGAFYHRQSNFSEAEKHHRMCMEIRKKLLGDIHQDTLTAQQALAHTLEMQGNRTEAAELYQSCVGLCEKDSRANQLTLAQAHAALGAFCYRQSRYAEAAKQERRCLQIREQVLGDAHPDTILARRALADTVEEEGKRADSTQLYQRNVELCEKNTTIDQLTTAQAKADLGAFYYRHSKYAEAAEQERRCLQIRERLLGDTHPDTLAAQRALRETLANHRKRTLSNMAAIIIFLLFLTYVIIAN